MTDIKAPPYPADTRAKGWRFELDHERIRQSDTWALAPADVRPWLLMLWMVAWEQAPCGSFPDDDALIAARIGMQPRAFAKARAVLMRGWVLAEDGRLYHETITARVMEMLEYRAKNAKRVADFKARMREQQCGNALPARESLAKNDTGTGTGTNTSQDKPVMKARAARSSAPDCPADVSPDVWTDWLALRAKKRTTASATAIDAARAEAGKAGLTFEQFLRVWCLRGSQGLQADWLTQAELRQFRAAGGGETDWQRSQREKVHAFTGGILGNKPSGQRADVFDVEEVGHAPGLAVG